MKVVLANVLVIFCFLPQNSWTFTPCQETTYQSDHWFALLCNVSIYEHDKNQDRIVTKAEVNAGVGKNGNLMEEIDKFHALDFNNDGKIDVQDEKIIYEMFDENYDNQLSRPELDTFFDWAFFLQWLLYFFHETDSFDIVDVDRENWDSVLSSNNNKGNERLLLGKYDLNNDGTVDLEETLDMFDSLDADKNKKMSKKELMQLYRELNPDTKCERVM